MGSTRFDLEGQQATVENQKYANRRSTRLHTATDLFRTLNVREEAMPDSDEKVGLYNQTREACALTAQDMPIVCSGTHNKTTPDGRGREKRQVGEATA